MNELTAEFQRAVDIDWEARIARNKQTDVPTTILKNCYLYLKHAEPLQGVIALDAFANEVVKRKLPPWPSDPGPWTDIDDLRVRVYFAERYKVDFATSLVTEAVQLVAEDNAYHPVRDYLESLRWDEQGRLQHWLVDYLGAVSFNEPDYLRYLGTAGAFWLIAAVARVYQPGCKADNVLILEGRQGVGKSSALRILAEPWFGDTPFLIGDKDGYAAMRGKWIYELAELDAFNKAEATKAKAFFSSSIDSYRPPYGRRIKDFPRQCVFAGSTNQDEYLRDPTGNRRFWPVLCQCIELEKLAEDRDQLWAEALLRYQDGTPWWPSEEVARVFEQQQELRESVDPWESILEGWLAQPENVARTTTSGFGSSELLHEALRVEPSRMDERAMAMRIGKCMRRLGYQRVATTTKAQRQHARHVYVKRD